MPPGSSQAKPSPANPRELGSLATLALVTKNPVAALKNRLARKARLPEIHARLDNQHNRLLGIRQRLEDVAQNLEFQVTSIDQQSRQHHAVISRALVNVERATADLTNEMAAFRSGAIQLQNNIDQVQRNLDSGLGNAENRLLSLNDALVAHIETFREIDRSWVSEELAQLRRSVDSLRRAIEAAANSAPLASPAKPGQAISAPPITDLGYIDLEDMFRGSRVVIAERQATYLPLVQNVASDAPIVDLGCGRGEWLTLLKENGIPARGVDMNVHCVSECEELGLEVIQSDILTFLSASPENSLRAITAFQVLEHFSFGDLHEIIRLCQRALVPGGLLLAEVPNAKNARVASGTFWIDPTHVRPWYPDLLEFMAKTSGFSRVEGRYVNPLLDEPDLTSLDPNSREALHSVFRALFGPADYALTAWS